MANLTPKYKEGKWEAAVPSKEILGDLYGQDLPLNTATMREVIGALQDETLRQFRDLNSGRPAESQVEMPSAYSFNNCNGRWTEYIFSAFLWNALASYNRNNDTALVFVKLPPSKEGRSWLEMLIPSIRELVSEIVDFSWDENLVEVVRASAFGQMTLDASNPDAFILAISKTYLHEINAVLLDQVITDIPELSSASQDVIDGVFAKIHGKINNARQIKCVLSVKNSIRPDRRYQITNEGNNIKSYLFYLVGALRRANGFTYEYLKSAFRFYGVCFSSINEADKSALSTGSTITYAFHPPYPVWSVDKFFECLRLNEIQSIMQVIIG